MGLDASTLMEKLNVIEARLSKIEEEVAKRREIVVIDETHLLSAKEAVKDFLSLSERLKGQWKGTLSSVDEVRKMRKRQRGY